jgi:sugar-specific transcriptional regulator TrmB
MDLERGLGVLGLSQNEIKVYLALVDFGSSKAGKIAKATKIQRSSCYEAVNSLLNKGLVSFAIVGKIKFFQATSPRRLLEIVKEQEDVAKQILPKLSEKHKATKITGQVRLFKGMKGVVSVLNDIIRDGSDNCVFGSEGQLRQKMPEFHRQFIRQLKENKIKVREIAREGSSKTNLENTRFVPKAVNSPVVTNIYGDKIAIIIWTDEPEAIVIENSAAAEAYRNYFEFMWKNARK